MSETVIIHAQMSKIMADVEAIGKNQQSSGGGSFTFNYRGIDDMYNELHSLFAKHRVVVYPRVIERERITADVKRGNNTKNRTHDDTHGRVLVYAEDGSHVSATTCGEGVDTGDKSINKAQSGAMKYALMQTFLIPTEDLIDQDEETQVDGQQVAAPSVPEYPDDDERLGLVKDIGESMGLCEWDKKQMAETMGEEIRAYKQMTTADLKDYAERMDEAARKHVAAKESSESESDLPL